MADQRGLQFIGWMFGAVTAAVMFIAAMTIANADRGLDAWPSGAPAFHTR